MSNKFIFDEWFSEFALKEFGDEIRNKVKTWLIDNSCDVTDALVTLQIDHLPTTWKLGEKLALLKATGSIEGYSIYAFHLIYSHHSSFIIYSFIILLPPPHYLPHQILFFYL